MNDKDSIGFREFYRISLETFPFISISILDSKFGNWWILNVKLKREKMPILIFFVFLRKCLLGGDFFLSNFFLLISDFRLLLSYQINLFIELSVNFSLNWISILLKFIGKGFPTNFFQLQILQGHYISGFLEFLEFLQGNDAHLTGICFK